MVLRSLENAVSITPTSPLLTLLVGFVDIHFPSILIVFHSTFKVLHSLAQQTQLYTVPQMLRSQLFDTNMYRHTVYSLNVLYVFTFTERVLLRLPTSSPTSTLPKKIQPIRVSQRRSSLSSVGQSSLSR